MIWDILSLSTYVRDLMEWSSRWKSNTEKIKLLCKTDIRIFNFKRVQVDGLKGPRKMRNVEIKIDKID